MNQVKRKKRNRSRRRHGLLDVVNAFLTLVVLLLVIIGTIVVFGSQRFYSDGDMDEDKVFLVERGAGLATIAQRLVDADLIPDRWTFQFGAVAQRKQTAIKAGEYNIVANSSMADILKELTEGRPITYAVTIPEGFTSWQVVERINAAQNLVGELVDIPPEGTLLPNTYSFERGDDRQSILDQMSSALEVQLAEVWQARKSDLPITTPEELLILASIVEKETGIASERAKVAAVFINRLNRGMRLQSDPTIIYGITNGEGPLGRGLKRSEIEAATPYNTYQIDGLPVGPIANPGIDALRAVANPADIDALFFVADGSGGHAFAKSYADHQANVAHWRQVERDRAEAAAEAEQAEAEADAAAARDALEAEQAAAVAQ